MTSSELLSHDDLRYIETLGVPAIPRPDLVLTRQDGTLEFTPKGEAFYRLACESSGVSFSPAGIATEKDLAELGYRLGAIQLQALTRRTMGELAAKRVSAQEIAFAMAAVAPDLEAALAAAQRQDELAARGCNVIAFPAKKNRS